MLFKNLGVDMKDIMPSCVLKNHKREIEGNPDFSNKDIGVSQCPVVPEAKPTIMGPLCQVELPTEIVSPSNSAVHTHLLSQVCTGSVLVLSIDCVSCFTDIILLHGASMVLHFIYPLVH